jgi:starch-binding outer membrane protein, SusD/RagB family
LHDADSLTINVNIMRTFIKYTILTSIILMFNQCNKDFLDTVPLSDLSTQSYFKNATDAENALIGCYNQIMITNLYSWTFTIILDVTSDNNYAGGDNPDYFKLDIFNRNPMIGDLFECWLTLYGLVNRCNNVLKYVPEISDSKLDVDNRRAVILGEATFLRALAYFNLVRMWGDVPIITAPTETMDPGSTNLSRSPVDQVYAQIITDLEYCLTVLPKADVPSQAGGHATQGAAYALLAQVYAAKAPTDWSKVKEYCDDVISSNMYELLPDYDQLFDGDHYNNSESIFEIQYEQPSATTWAYQIWCPPSLTGDSWRKFMTPSVDLIQTYRAEGDSIRLHSSVIWEEIGQYWNDPVYGTVVPFVYKFRHPGGWASDDHFYIMRLAETILLRAEARNELNDMTGAMEDLQLVRDRVSLPAKSLSSKDEVRDAVLLERRLELAFECYRWWDLLRTGRAISTMKNLGYDPVEPRDLLFPIPQDERNRNPNLTQNTGF